MRSKQKEKDETDQEWRFHRMWPVNQRLSAMCHVCSTLLEDSGDCLSIVLSIIDVCLLPSPAWSAFPVQLLLQGDGLLRRPQTCARPLFYGTHGNFNSPGTELNSEIESFLLWLSTLIYIIIYKLSTWRCAPWLPAIPPPIMSREPSISSKDPSEKVSQDTFGRSEVDSSQIDVAARIAIGGHDENISEEQARNLKYAGEAVYWLLTYWQGPCRRKIDWNLIPLMCCEWAQHVNA